MRAAAESAYQGMVAQEVVDQLVAAAGEPHIGSEWIERARTVLVAHPGQVFSGQLRRFDTTRRMGRSPLYWMWERNLVRHAQVSAYHRFRPIDRALVRHGCETLTTLLPAEKGLPLTIGSDARQRFVVPARKDAVLLGRRYGVAPERISVVRPGVRRYVHFSEGPKPVGDAGYGLIVTRHKGNRSALKKLEKVLDSVFPNLPRGVLPLSPTTDLSPRAWQSLLAKTRLLVYLPDAPFDWGTLVLESIYWRIPTLFSEFNSALGELLPGSPLGLARFLVDQPDLAAIARHTDEARRRLETDGVFDPFSAARQYRAIYQTLPTATA